MCYFVAAYINDSVDANDFEGLCKGLGFNPGRIEGYLGFPKIRGFYAYHLTGGICDCGTPIGSDDEARWQDLQPYVDLVNSVSTLKRIKSLMFLKHMDSWGETLTDLDYETIHIDDFYREVLLEAEVDIIYKIQYYKRYL